MAESSAPKMTSEQVARRCAELCEEHKGENVLLYDVKGNSVLADYYLICTGTSEPHLRALSGYVDKDMAQNRVAIKKVSGTPASLWIVLDLGDVIVHLFNPTMREHYRIEELWDDRQIVWRSRDAS